MKSESDNLDKMKTHIVAALADRVDARVSIRTSESYSLSWHQYINNINFTCYQQFHNYSLYWHQHLH